jgi:hypothetical protein
VPYRAALAIGAAKGKKKVSSESACRKRQKEAFEVTQQNGIDTVRQAILDWLPRRRAFREAHAHRR